MKAFTLALALLYGLWVPPAVAATRDADQYFFDQTLGDFSDELRTAREQGKQGVLIMFEMADCPFCHWMKQRVLNQVTVQDYYRQHFLIFPVDTRGDVEISDFSGANVKEKDFATQNMAGPATPAFVFYDLSGRRLVRFTGKTDDAQEFLLLGHYVVDGAYRHTSFSRFKRDHRER